MTKIDQRALEAAIDAWRSSAKRSGTVEESMRAAILAYEAARWRPIEEADKSEGADLLLWSGENTVGEGYFDKYVGEGPSQKREGAWCWAGEGVCNPQPTMFRTIDPPLIGAKS